MRKRSLFVRCLDCDRWPEDCTCLGGVDREAEEKTQSLNEATDWDRFYGWLDWQALQDLEERYAGTYDPGFWRNHDESDRDYERAEVWGWEGQQHFSVRKEAQEDHAWASWTREKNSLHYSLGEIETQMRQMAADVGCLRRTCYGCHEQGQCPDWEDPGE